MAVGKIEETHDGRNTGGANVKQKGFEGEEDPAGEWLASGRTSPRGEFQASYDEITQAKNH